MRRAIIVTAVWVFLTQNAMAQDLHAADRQALLEIMAKVESALNAKDLEPAKKYLLPTTVVIFQDTTVVTGPAEIEAYFVDILGDAESVLSGITIKAQADGPATFLSDDIAVAYGHTTDTFEFRTGNTFDLYTSWSTTVIRSDDGWRIAALHFSNNLFDNPVLDGAKQFTWYAGGIGFLGGLLLMMIVRRLRKS